ncbi:CvpA family protein [[Clostridium] polysaccharolyticum]|uniref:Colicin V production protein n=1 Tax=[Clostridium] polysaccharolyticum TaxID=29364 RepID=A0A1I0DB15_9FIRM|nr:CvpA family protein [[Clostridium] polysaccharolyticum]SET29424.1 Colicin V production protein [[Clostridium] polysaccharolyticum]
MQTLEIVVAFILLVFGLKGMKQGLVLTICSLVTMFLAITVTQTVTPQISARLRENEKVVDVISEQVQNVLFHEENSKKREKLSDNEKIEALGIPKMLKEDLLENANQKKYNELGAASVNEYVSVYIAYWIINSITYIVVFLIVLSILKILIHALNIITKLPVVNTLNKLGGLGIGVLEGLVIIWVGFVLITATCSTALGNSMLNQINKSRWLLYLYNNNLILKAVMSVTKALF